MLRLYRYTILLLHAVLLRCAKTHQGPRATVKIVAFLRKRKKNQLQKGIDQLNWDLLPKLKKQKPLISRTQG